jgi:cytochrome P450
MLLLILSCLLGVAVLPVAILILKVLISKQKLKFYQKQGMPILFSATMGHVSLEDSNLPENSKISNLEYMKKITKAPEIKEAGVFAINFALRTESIVHLLNSDMVREFLLKEDCFDRSISFPDLPGVFGLAFYDNQRAVRSRMLFMKMFRPEGMEMFTPLFCEAIHQGLADFAKNNNIDASKATRVSLDDLFYPIVARVANILIFGTEDINAVKEMEELPKLVVKILDLINSDARNLWKMILPEKLAKTLGLAPHAKQIDVYFSKQQQILQRYIERRSKETNLGESIIDRSIIHNRECLRDGNTQDILTIEDITGNYNLFFVAGADTARNISKGVLCHMTSLPKIKKLIDDINKQIYDPQGFTTTQAIESCQELSMWFKECLRFHLTASRTIPRVAIKEVKFGKFTIRKGDYVTKTLSVLLKDEEFFKDPETFDPTRFTSENEKLLPKYQFIPFSLGKRVCLGRYLGELMVKLVVTKFSQFFEYEKPADVEYYRDGYFIIALKNPIVNLRLKSAEKGTSK